LESASAYLSSFSVPDSAALYVIDSMGQFVAAHGDVDVYRTLPNGTSTPLKATDSENFLISSTAKFLETQQDSSALQQFENDQLGKEYFATIFFLILL
jgi:hypothetical protein